MKHVLQISHSAAASKNSESYFRGGRVRNRNQVSKYSRSPIFHVISKCRQKTNGIICCCRKVTHSLYAKTRSVQSEYNGLNDGSSSPAALQLSSNPAASSPAALQLSGRWINQHSLGLQPPPPAL